MAEHGRRSVNSARNARIGCRRAAGLGATPSFSPAAAAAAIRATRLAARRAGRAQFGLRAALERRQRHAPRTHRDCVRRACRRAQRHFDLGASDRRARPVRRAPARPPRQRPQRRTFIRRLRVAGRRAGADGVCGRGSTPACSAASPSPERAHRPRARGRRPRSRVARPRTAQRPGGDRGRCLDGPPTVMSHFAITASPCKYRSPPAVAPRQQQSDERRPTTERDQQPARGAPRADQRNRGHNARRRTRPAGRPRQRGVTATTSRPGSGRRRRVREPDDQRPRRSRDALREVAGREPHGRGIAYPIALGQRGRGRARAVQAGDLRARWLRRTAAGSRRPGAWDERSWR